MRRAAYASAALLVNTALAFLIIAAAVSVFIFRSKPEPCPTHICLPAEMRSSPEALVASDPCKQQGPHGDACRRAARERLAAEAAEFRRQAGY